MKKIHQIWITDNNQEPSDYIKKQMSQVKFMYSDYEYKLWTNSDIVNFLIKHFDKQVLECYENIKAFAFKSDLARYCILYVYGGIYIDSALKFLTKINFTESLIIAKGISNELVSQNKPLFENNLIICNEIGHNFLKTAINKCVENILNKHYHTHPLEITGPIMLAQIENQIDITILSVKYHRGSKCTFVNEQPFMKHKHHRTQASLLKLNCVGTNNYEKMWFEKKIY